MFQEERERHEIPIVIRNDLKVDCSIVAVANSCGCVKVEPANLRVPARAEIPATVSLDLQRRLGLQRFYVAFSDQDKATHRLELVLVAEAAVRVLHAHVDPAGSLDLQLRLAHRASEDSANGGS